MEKFRASYRRMFHSITLILLLIEPLQLHAATVAYWRFETGPANTAMANWTSVTTRVFDTNGTFTFTTPFVPGAPQNYYALKTLVGPPAAGAMTYQLAGDSANWSANLSGGIWTGSYGIQQIQAFDGAGAVINSDGTHFWPYGLNYDNEGGTENYRRHVLMVAAFRRDMGIP